MKLTCSQMDVLIAFCIEGELSKSLKKEVENHLKICPSCRAKYDIVKSIMLDITKSLNNNDKESTNNDFYTKTTSQQYRVFRNNLSAYIDNELPTEESVKIRKLAINNSQVRKDLEDNYNIKRLINESFLKTKNNSKVDFTKNILHKLDIEQEATLLNIHPLIKWAVIFCISGITVSILALLIFGL